MALLPEDRPLIKPVTLRPLPTLPTLGGSASTPAPFYDPTPYMSNPGAPPPKPIGVNYANGDLSLQTPTQQLPGILGYQDAKAAWEATQAQNAKAQSIANEYNGGSGGKAYTGGRTGLASQRGPAPYGFQSNMWDALGKMNAAMKAAGLGTFGITDGWRSYESQVALKKKKPNLAATPGRSIHGLGLAADLRLTSKQAAWIRANAGKFGLRVPMPGKEPWHVQWAGA